MSWPIWQSPGWLWALLILPVLVVGLVAWARSGRRAAAAWSDPAVMAVGPSRRTRTMRAAAGCVAVLAVAAGIVALARPSVEATGQEQRSSVMITLDVSDSMDKTDLQPSRLAAAVDAAERFVDAAPEHTSIGITTFADRASVLLAPTTDRTTIKNALEGIDDTREGTALGAAVTTSLAALQANGSVADPPPADPSDSPGRIMVLTDGANSIRNATSPDAAAERAAAAGVPIYTILLGDDPGRPDQPLPSETLSAMASRTGGHLRPEHDHGRPPGRLLRHRVGRRPGRRAARADGLGRRRGASGCSCSPPCWRRWPGPARLAWGASAPPDRRETATCNVASAGCVRFGAPFGVHAGPAAVNLPPAGDG